MQVETIQTRATVSSTLEDFFALVRTADESTLLLDFDGTLAPFRIDPLQVRPWAGVPELLAEIHKLGTTRIVIISGRPAAEVASQLGLSSLEIWGLHGVERRFPDGRVELDQLLPQEHDTLAGARKAIRSAAFGQRIRVEDKWNAVAVHWRGQSPQTSEALLKVALSLLQPFGTAPTMHLLQFDGGVELRAGRNKGDAVRLLLNEMHIDAPVAYLGDDTTDEDAFRALTGRGLTVLVRSRWRPTSAALWLRPPTQLRGFLSSWVNALRG